MSDQAIDRLYLDSPINGETVLNSTLAPYDCNKPSGLNVGWIHRMGTGDYSAGLLDARIDVAQYLVIPQARVVAAVTHEPAGPTLDELKREKLEREAKENHDAEAREELEVA